MEIAVLGAGLAALGFARQIPNATIYESKRHPGGHAYSHDSGGVSFDEGAHISHTKDQRFRDLIQAAADGVDDGIAAAVRNYWKGHWTGYPIQNHLRDLPTENAVQALTGIVMSAVSGTSGEPASYREWCRRQYGDYLTDEFYEMFTEKYWRCDTSDLATDWLGGRLIPSDLTNIIRGALSSDVADQAAFATFRYPKRGGFFNFFASLYEPLNIQTGYHVEEIDLRAREITFTTGTPAGFDVLASSIPLPDLVSALRDAPTDVRDAAGTLRHTKLLCVNMVVDRPDLTDSPWCYIYDHDIEPARLSFPGNLSPSSIVPGTTAVQAEIFRSDREHWGNIDGLAERTASQMAELLEFDEDSISTLSTVEVSHAYIVSDHARAAAVDQILSWLKTQGVYTMGLYGKWKYMWSDAAFRSGEQTAEKLKADYGFN